MKDACLAVLNPRHIPECVAAIGALGVPKMWLEYMYEAQAAHAFNEQVRRSPYEYYVVISDDCVPTQAALDAVLDATGDEHPVVTGYCNLDSALPYVNLTVNRLPPPPPSAASYTFLTYDEANSHSGLVHTTFAGLALTCMHRDLWLQHPLHTTSTGGAIDYQLSWELQRDGIDIYAPAAAFVHHVKEVWNTLDRAPEKQLLVGQRPAGVRWEAHPSVVAP